MLEEMIAEALQDTGRLWTLNTGKIVPMADDVRKVLDEAAKVLYDRDVGARFEAGGLIIEKRERHFEVFVHFGQYH